MDFIAALPQGSPPAAAQPAANLQVQCEHCKNEISGRDHIGVWQGANGANGAAGGNALAIASGPFDSTNSATGTGGSGGAGGNGGDADAVSLTIKGNAAGLGEADATATGGNGGADSTSGGVSFSNAGSGGNAASVAVVVGVSTALVTSNATGGNGGASIEAAAPGGAAKARATGSA